MQTKKKKLARSIRFALYPVMKGFSVLRNAFDVPPKVELLAVQSSPRRQREMFISLDKAVSIDLCAVLASSSVLYIKLQGLLGKLSEEKIIPLCHLVRRFQHFHQESVDGRVSD